MNPFPGINPYLEQSRFWRGFHNGLIFAIQAFLNEHLPPGYAANYEEQVVLLPLGQSIVPDVMVTERESVKPYAQQSSVAVLNEPTTFKRVVALPEELAQGYLEIVTGEEFEQVVTVIEVLSPTNKTNGVHRDAYLRKQQQLLSSSTSLLEIDLLRQGQHTVAVPKERLREETWDGIACLHRSWNRYHFDCWFCRWQNTLPPLTVPLLQDDGEIALDFAAIYTQVYDLGPYRRSINFNIAPPIPISKEEAAWMDALLREKGLRT